MSQYYYNPFGGSGVNEESQRIFLRKKQENEQKREIRKISFAMGCAIVAYILVQNVVAILLPILGLTDLYTNNSVFQSAFTIIGVSFLSVAVPFGVMALINKKKYDYPIIQNNPLKPLRGFVWVSFGMLCCIIANVGVTFIISFMENLFNVTFTQGELLDPDSVLACVMTCISTAIIPPICEEFAMRCCSLQLLRKYGKGFAVFAVSIVFGLLHGNVVQFIFAFTIGLVLGFVTIKTESIVPAVLIHAFSNGISAMNSVLLYTSGEKAGQNAILIAYALWTVLGLGSLLYLLVKGEFKPAPKPQNDILTNVQKFTAFLFPWMIVPFVILIVLTAFTIVGK